jgi:hypothetical protein
MITGGKNDSVTFAVDDRHSVLGGEPERPSRERNPCGGWVPAIRFRSDTRSV